MSLPTCSEPGCDNLGVFTLVDSDGATSQVCYDHYAVGENGAAPPDLDDDIQLFHVDVTAGFAAMLLRHTAIAMNDDPEAIEEAMTLLSDQTGLSADVCSGFLLAATAMVAIGGIDEEQLLKLAEQYELQAEWEDQPPPPPAGTVVSMVPGLGSDGSSEPDVGPDDERDAMADETYPVEDVDGEDDSEQPTTEEVDDDERDDADDRPERGTGGPGQIPDGGERGAGGR